MNRSHDEVIFVVGWDYYVVFLLQWEWMDQLLVREIRVVTNEQVHCVHPDAIPSNLIQSNVLEP